jgi:hypothetical protein
VIVPSDSDYQETKRVVLGLSKLVWPFDELARWIASTWQVTVLNVIYDGRNSLHAPRLNVVLENQWEAWGFYAGVNFDAVKEQAIKEKFYSLIAERSGGGFDVEGLFVFYSAFAPIARSEADSHISEDDIKKLQHQIANPDIWRIWRSGGAVTFFFFTEAQARRHAEEGNGASYAHLYFDLLKPHDEFGYLDEREFSVAFDSKENLDQNYAGSLFNYDR